MREHRLETRIDAVIHWLERMKSAYTSGAVESAYLDAECARADLDDIKSDVFARITPVKHTNIFTTIIRLSQVIVLAAIIVMSMVIPLSHENVTVTPAVPAETVAEIPAQITPPSTQETKPRKRRASPPKKPAQSQTTAKQPQKSQQPQKPAKTVAHDKIYSLIQTGQRALKNDNSVINVK